MRWRQLFAVALLLATACDGNVSGAGDGDGGDSSSGNGDGDTDTGSDSPPDVPTELAVTWPPDGATTADRIEVRGTGLPGATTSVSVAGLAAASNDDFATWRVEVPLSVGANDLVVAATVDGDVVELAISIDRWADEASGARGDGVWPGRILGMGYDRDSDRAIVSDDFVDGVYGIDVASGDRVVLSDSESTVEVGSGYEIVRPTRVAVHAGRALVADGDVLVDIDLATGDRTAISEPGGAGSGVAIESVRDLAIDPTTGRTLVLVGDADGGGPGLVELDRDTGARALVTTSGASLDNAFRLAVDWDRDRAVVLRQYSDSVTTIDLISGARAALPNPGGAAFSEPLHVALAGDAALVWADGELVRIALADGARTVPAGNGIELRGVAAMTDSPRGVLVVEYVPDWEDAPRAPMLVSVDPVTGARVVLAR